MMRPLQGHTVLLVEDVYLLATHAANAIEQAGAQVIVANTLSQALELIETDGLSAAIVNHLLHNQDTSGVRDRLTERGIPFITYSGTSPRTPSDTHVSKPATGDALVAALTKLLSRATPCAS